MIKSGTEIGKLPYSDISPDQYDIDVKKKKINKKRFNQLIANDTLFSTVAEIE